MNKERLQAKSYSLQVNQEGLSNFVVITLLAQKHHREWIVKEIIGEPLPVNAALIRNQHALAEINQELG